MNIYLSSVARFKEPSSSIEDCGSFVSAANAVCRRIEIPMGASDDMVSCSRERGVAER